jgi:amidase
MIDIEAVIKITKALFSAEMAPSRSPQSGGSIPTVVDYINLLEERNSITQLLESILDTCNALILPVTVSAAFHHVPHESPISVDGQDVEYWMAVTGHTFPFNLTGNPAVVIPIGQSPEGLPIGVQVVGKRWQDARLLGVAKALAGVTQGFRRPPGY